jgi:hypothetical protein
LTTLLPPAIAPAPRVQRAPSTAAPSGPRPSLHELFGGVQRKDGDGPSRTAAIHASAQAGIATSTSRLPFAESIQRSFGRHDISGIRAHTGADAAATAVAMGAQAYATGDHVVLGPGADLHTVAHEAAHVVQQRGGVSLAGGVGAVGDPHEQHADAVAERVVRGESAEVLLDDYARTGPAPSGGAAPVQHKVGFEFETGISVSRDQALLTKKTPIGTQAHTGWKVEADDDGRMEFIVDPALEITKNLGVELAAIFDKIEPYCAGLEHAANQHRHQVVEEQANLPPDPTLEDGFKHDEEEDEQGSEHGSDSELEHDGPEYTYDQHPLSEATLVPGDAPYLVTPQVPIRANPQITAGLTLAQVAKLPERNQEKRLPKAFGEIMPTTPSTFVPRVTPQLFEKCGVVMGELGHQISDELKGLLTMVASYLVGGTSEYIEYPKRLSDSFLLARTDFATLFRMAPEWRYFARHPDQFEAVALAVANLAGAGASPVYVHGILVNAQVNMDRNPFGPTRTAWLRGIAGGTDIMTQAHTANAAYESMGEKGSKTELVGASDGATFANGGIFEMRGGQTTPVGYAEWRAFALEAAAFLQNMQRDPAGQLGQMAEHAKLWSLLRNK